MLKVDRLNTKSTNFPHVYTVRKDEAVKCDANKKQVIFAKKEESVH